MRRVLILFAHPAQHRSEINTPLFKASLNRPGVTAVDLYARYPTFNIDISAEQQQLLDHDVIVFMFPLYWYSTPALLKEWQDLVLEHNFAYGSQGLALKDKHFFCALSAGGSEKGYQHEGYNHFTIRELLQPLEQTANLTHMRYLPPFALFSSRTAADDGRAQQHQQTWTQILDDIVAGQIDLDAAAPYATFNQFWQERSA
ncbi:potassium transporter KefG [Bacterioplanes sanyensis]|uniref:Potassium transporter KefG n=1 Tax=Bacterioplanes sanyensis TaxID=1249553 RepID=A0A222FM57_9GAMM|nr:NAD(P)H-dependent oxidoreductase [Bacterioplanes sanyensis]ASP40107.1 potassium transporter KefG [Bacterioplanes sanyensis]